MTTDSTLYITDLDGTLLGRDAEVSEYSRAALNRMITGGLNFSVATARTLASAGKILSCLTLNLPIVLLNGVLTYDMLRQEYTQVNALAPETVAAVIQTLRQFEITGFMYELKDGELTTYHESLEQKPLRDFVEERIARYYKSFRHTDGFGSVSPENVIYFTLRDTYERLKPVHDAAVNLPGLKLTMYGDTYSPELWYLELFSDKASKQNAVQCLRESCGFERIVGFGDNLNDLPMFMACDVRVAVENAKPEVKAAADHICGANTSDGVARWIEDHAR